LRTERVDRLPVAGAQARQPIELIVDPRRRGHDPPEGVRRHAKASRHANAFDPRKLPQLRALAAGERDLRFVDLFETQHVALGHRDTPGWPCSTARIFGSPISIYSGPGLRLCGTTRALPQAPGCAIY